VFRKTAHLPKNIGNYMNSLLYRAHPLCQSWAPSGSTAKGGGLGQRRDGAANERNLPTAARREQ
jgi:hypothetical protein